MWIRKVTGISMLAIGVAIVVGFGLPPQFVAATPNEKCCKPAHAETPTGPPASHPSCIVVNNQCTNEGSIKSCTGDAFQNAVAGICTVGHPEDICLENTAVTIIPVKKGYFKCAPFFEDSCLCLYKLYDPPQQQNVQVNTCTGGACAG